MIYKASFDLPSKIITIAICVGIPAILLTKEVYSSFNFTTSAIVVILSLLLLPACYLFSIKDYVVNDSALIIRRPMSSRIIPLTEIEEARLVADGEMRGTIRTFGNGGLFGYYGKFYNRKLGYMTWYATQRRNMVYIKTRSGKKIIISPDDTSIINKLIA